MLQDFKVYRYRRGYFVVLPLDLNTEDGPNWNLRWTSSSPSIDTTKNAKMVEGNKTRVLVQFYADEKELFRAAGASQYTRTAGLLHFAACSPNCWPQFKQEIGTNNEWDTTHPGCNYFCVEQLRRNFYINHFINEIHPIDINTAKPKLWNKLCLVLAHKYRAAVPLFIQNNRLSNNKKFRLFEAQLSAI